MVLEFVKSDLYRYVGNTRVSSFISQFIISRGFRYTFWLRVAKCEVLVFKRVAKYFHKALSKKYSIDIPLATQIGYGLYIKQALCVIVNPSTKIGDNCNLSPFTVIGSQSNCETIIGNNVHIGSNVSIVEDVTIENNTTIREGAIVSENIAENLTVAGIPSIEETSYNPGRFIVNRWLS